MEGEVTILAILKVPDNQYCVKKTFHKRKKRYPLNPYKILLKEYLPMLTIGSTNLEITLGGNSSISFIPAPMFRLRLLL